MRVTLQELIDAAEKNGYKWGGAPKGRDDERFCVLEQVALNFGLKKIAWMYIADALDRLGFVEDRGLKVGHAIWAYNDTEAKSYQDVVKYVKTTLDKYPKDKIIIFKKV